ncbi:hypothetical protein SAMN05444003_2791 [Cognatiyoonia sediminum]|uniref:VOC domain-containing protein n=1 Tax=Cognatiyoonia sediminum TaxID=1508389 RepID=A0A1M5S0D4_9RHOB|nr:VOC family protein [Cognatiyoonia sediminum]SHH31926.1 hypothetical protein SAMN05444003_2791 [Cognatiyoonia sediminum]
MTTSPVLVWCEIPVTDLDKSAKFYESVFGYTTVRDDTQVNPMVNLTTDMQAIAGHLYPGTPASDGGNTIHLALSDKLEDGMKRCADAGGEVVSPIITIPPGRFAYAKDIDGNSIGLFEPAMA